MARTKQTEPKRGPPGKTKKFFGKKNVEAAKSEPARVKKPHRFRPGTVALRQIRKCQKGGEELVPRAPMERAVRQIAESVGQIKDVRFRPDAINAAKSAAEAYLVEVLDEAYNIANATGCVTLMPRHLKLAVRVFEKGQTSQTYPKDGWQKPTVVDPSVQRFLEKVCVCVCVFSLFSILLVIPFLSYS